MSLNLDSSDSLKKFVESFFRSMNCEIINNETKLTVKNVPENFEKDFGKKSPYIFVFDLKDSSEDTELISKGSSLIKLMASYLENKGQNTLLKINFSIDPKTIIQELISNKDLEIQNITEKYNPDLIYRFTFKTNMQYINEREQFINTIYTKNENILEDFKIENYNTVDGKKEEIKIHDIKNDYEKAKEKLKILIHPKIKEITDYLNQGLEIEIRRIKSHFMHELDDINKEVMKNDETIKVCEEKLKKDDITPLQIKKLNEKIMRAIESNHKLKDPQKHELMKKEEEFYTIEQKNKHAINVNNSLANTTIIYYPISTIKFYFKKNNLMSKQIEITYNPLTKEVTPIKCSTCNNPLIEINLCNHGHVTCKNDMRICPYCKNNLCNSCEKIDCVKCKREICNKCKTKCIKCQNYACSNHVVKIDGKTLCSNCTEFCQVCGKHKEKDVFGECSKCKRLVCSTCSSPDVSTNKIICNSCYF